MDDDEILSVFAAAETPVLTTADVAESLPISRRATLDRLKSLREEGRLESMDVGATAQVWWVDDSTESEETAPAAPLRDLAGMLDEDEADTARARSQEWRDEFDQQMRERTQNANGS